MGQDTLIGGFQCGNIIQQSIPHRGDINRTIGVNIEVPSVLDDASWNRLVLRLSFVGKLRNQFTDLNDTHAASVLKEVALLKSGKVMVVAL